MSTLSLQNLSCPEMLRLSGHFSPAPRISDAERFMKRSEAPQQPRPRRFSLLVSSFFVSLLSAFCSVFVSLIAFVYLFVSLLSNPFSTQKKERKFATEGKGLGGHVMDGVFQMGREEWRRCTFNIRLDGNGWLDGVEVIVVVVVGDS